ncbi:MAG TPA: serine hydrolase [Longimicrobiales bacterium]|nr:serine hydrolase [Longimicrobiales bacterium]
MRRRMMLPALLAAAFLANPAAAQRPAAPPPGLDGYVADVLRAFEVPGVALTIVKDGAVVVARGYGVRELGRAEPVDETTKFGIASNTKAFTATALALLVEEGRLEWDRPVIDYLPSFRLSDPFVTGELTVRDLLVHRSGLGLGAGDLLWWPESSYDRGEIVHRLRHIPLATSFRSAYAYDNVLYLVAGELIAAVSGQSWEDFVSARILGPLGMQQAAVRHSAALAGGNVATPHAPVEGRVRPVRPFGSDNTNPAGGIMAGAADMAKWLLVQLDSGRIRGSERRLFSARTASELWTLVTPMPIRTPPPELAPLRSQFNGYALGFQVRDYRGRKAVMHTGGLPGYVSRVIMIPEAKLGVAVLTNQESGEAFEAIAYRVVDHYLEAPAHDWLAAYRSVAERSRAQVAAAEQGAAAARDSLSGPLLPLAAYAGTYRDTWYGDIAVDARGDGLRIRFLPTASLEGALVHWQHDTFLARWDDRELRADAFVTFALNPDGTVRELSIVPASPAVDFSFDFQDLRPVRVR